MKFALSVVRKITSYLVIILMGLNVITMCAGVVSRFAMNVSLTWTDELGATSLVWITFLGATMITIDDKHIAIDGLVGMLRPQSRRIIMLVANLLVLLFIYFMIRYGFIVTARITGDRLSSLPISRSVAMSVIPISAVLMFITMVDRIIKNIVNIVKNQDADGTVREGSDDV